jgi:uncharacterized protein
MSALKERLRADLTTAMKARDKVRSSTLRMSLTAVTNAEVSGAEARELTDAEVLEVLDKEAKKRREAAEAYDEAGRSDLAAKERTEGEIIAEYLPAQLSDDELAEIVQTAIAETGASGMKDMGAVMKVVQPQVKGRAEGGRVAAVVRSQLA